ncbi:MAG: Ig-like domain-containing protein [Solirubrobacterales bacterium]
MSSNGRGSLGLRLTITALAALIISALIPAVSSAAAPTIVNGANQGRWVESQAIGMDGSANVFRFTVVVRHDRGEAVDTVSVDDNWSNNNFDTINVVGTRQQTTIAGGNAYTRVTVTTTPETGGDSCPFSAPATQRRNDTYGIYAHTSSGNTQTVTATVHRVQNTYNCYTLLDAENYPYLYGQTQNKTSVDLGGTGDDVQFQFKGDDYDSTGGCDYFDGYRWRLRPLGGGATTPVTTVDTPGGDNSTQTLNITGWPGRGRWVVEAELACDTMNFVDVGGWWYIGAVDVNSPSSPTISLSGVPARPATDASFTTTASVADTPDSADLGHVEAVEWDKDGNNVYEEGEISSAWNTDLSAGQLQRTINTTGMTPGTYTIRARARDNGAISLADNSSKTAVGTATYTVNSPPVVNGQSITVEEGDDELVSFGGTDANSDTLSYSIIDQPDHGSLSGSGGSRTYSADSGYEGADSFEVEVNDGYNGIDTATITIQVKNTTKIDSGPNGPHNSANANFTFSSPEVGATFECSLDGAPFSTCTSPQSYTGLSESAHTFEVRAVVSGNPDPTPASRNFTVDLTNPDTTIDSGPNGPTNDPTASFSFSANEPGSTFKCSVDGAPFTSCSSPLTTSSLPDGPHTFEVAATDPAGNDDPTPASRSFTVDTNPPDTTINTGPSGPISTSAPQFTFSSPDNTATFECKIDAGPFNPCTSPYTTPTLPDGPHTVQVRAVDPAGNPDPTPDSRSFTIDTTPPDTQIDSGPSGFTNDATPEFQFSSADNTATFQCRVDGGSYSSCSSPFVTASLSDGSHTFYVRAVDPGGNIDPTPESRTFTVDTIAPQTGITSGPSGPTPDATPTFAFDADEPGSSFECRVDSDPFAPCTSPFTAASLPDGSHTFEVRAIDQANNVDPTPASRSFTVDTSPPGTTIDSGPSGTITTDAASFTFSSADGSAVFECKLDAGDWEECVSPQSFADLDDGAHTFSVRAVDPAGNADPAPPTRSFTVSTEGPETTIDSGPTGTVADDDATLTFSSDDNAATFECRLDGGSFAACTSPHSLTGLADGPHTLRVRAIDADSNVDPTPATRSWTVDTTAPSVSFDSGPNGVTKNPTPTFEFDADEAGTTFECRFDSDSFASCSSPLTASSPLGDGAHTLEVRATDGVGNLGNAASRSFTVDTAAPDTSIDSGPSGTVASSNATLGFSSTESGSSFTCTLDGNITACTSPKTYTGLGDGSHTFTVVATDPAGNTDPSPATRTWTVGGGGNPQTQITAGPSGRVLDRNASFEFTSSASGATFECSLDGAAFSACSSPQSYSGLSLGEHTFSVRSKSSGGATDPTPATRTFTVEEAAAPPSKLPPRIDVVGGKLKLKKGIQVATISCGFGPCSLDSAVAQLKAGKKKATLTPTVSGSIAANSTAPVMLTLKGKFYRAIKKKKKGTIKITLTVSSPAGTTKAATKIKLSAKKKKKGKG